MKTSTKYKYKIISTEHTNLGPAGVTFLYSIVPDTSPRGSFRLVGENQKELRAKIKAMLQALSAWKVEVEKKQSKPVKSYGPVYKNPSPRGKSCVGNVYKSRGHK